MNGNARQRINVGRGLSDRRGPHSGVAGSLMREGELKGTWLNVGGGLEALLSLSQNMTLLRLGAL